MGTIKHPSGAGSVTPQQEPGKHVRGTDAKSTIPPPRSHASGRPRPQIRRPIAPTTAPTRATRWLGAAGISKTIPGSVRPKEPSPVADFPTTRLEPPT